MKKCLFLLLLTLGWSTLTAQELKVIEFRADPTMNDAVNSPKVDGNGVNCALIRLGLVIPDAQFEGDIVSAEYKDGEWWIYMENGSNWITVKTKRYLPLRYEFEGVRSNVTYIMNIERPQVAYDGPTGTIRITCNLKNADVYVDGEKMSSVLPYDYKGPEGNHQVEIVADGYNREHATINVKLGQKLQHNVTLRPAGSFQLEGISYEMVKVPAGSFIMGSAAKPEDKQHPLNYAQPQHEVVLAPYSIGKTEVTQALWEKVMGSNPSIIPGPSRPVTNITYDDCLDFIAKLNQMSGMHFRLPTEAEWEYAARAAGKDSPDGYAGGVNKSSTPEAVGSKKPNALGIHDLSGNVAEWCSDWIHSYSPDREVNPQGPHSGFHRVVRGGSCNSADAELYTTTRSHQDPNEPSVFIGLRLAMDD